MSKVTGQREPEFSDVWAASRRIAGHVLTTPVIEATGPGTPGGAAALGLKLEQLQPTGSFKVRGAANRILSLSDEQKRRGVITFSTGNHGRAVSHIARALGIPAVVCLSRRVPEYRVRAIERLGARVEIHGDSQNEAERRYLELMERDGLTPVVPFDDPFVIAGQGTIALELAGQFERPDMLLVPLSGGGLLAGMALAMKNLVPEVQVVGVSLASSPVMLRSLEAGRAVELPEQETLGDSLLGGIGHENLWTMALVAEYVDAHVLVEEEDLAAGMRWAFRELGLVIEGASAAVIGALLSGRVAARGKRAAMPITGRNVEVGRYLAVTALQGDKQYGIG